ncbi:interferon-induced very large GTPase 1-like, partial [Seriola dumerili]|uniref:interferon-induced very large GTPase 1-like n=1 Tax=Seriola dumerili TaxID=41447 RepID=UPI000BBEBD5F
MDPLVKKLLHSAARKTHQERLLEDLGLEQHYTEKLSLSNILQIDERTITDETAKCQSDLPWYFLKKLMMVNVTARNAKCTSECESDCDAVSGNTKLDLRNLVDSPNSGDMLNPLDIITALFLCSDAFVQQEMALKMSMCQFSVPLLLPNCDTQQCTLMLWALRDIVKKYRPQSLSQSKGFIEDRIVLSELPMISFVRLGECSLSKSEILNKLLSNSQQYHDTFVHHDMECGDSPRRISDGLTEITWYLPCGNKNIDIFSEPVAVANLRGDITSFETQFSFLCQTYLPKLCAGLLLDGFPLELVDGDASNIPLRWVSDVLSQLHDLVSPKNKILVVTVLGVQSTGKSTLLNTMFGVQFAVSSGRCTRGAFMLLIRINEDVKKVLNCDFMVIIDTEGLKSPELAQLDDSHEHDNELATLVVGLSDITIINIAMENSTEMKDILQIVVHAFLRMKEVGKKPKCQFVHQNVSDVSANEKNLRDRKLLLQQLNEMTQAAAKMEKKEENKSFTDVMEYSPDTGNWYIPGLWNGNPPMAPVNAGYSEAVYELKKNIIHLLGKCDSSANDILEIKEWMSSLWTAVKHENFIFSFRNSLVADAYMRLCTEFNKWEWEFKIHMFTWVTNAETRIAHFRISNFGTVAAKCEIADMKDFITCLRSEASTVLSKWETKLLENLAQYFKQTEGHIYLVEGYKEDFANSAKSLRREMENSVFHQLTAAAEIKQGMRELDIIKENHTKEIEKAVCALIDQCRKKNVQMRDQELDKEFEKMWNETVKKLSFSEKKATDVFTSVSHYLRINLSHKGSHASELLSKKSLKDCGKMPFKYTEEGFCKQFKHRMSKWLNWQDHITMVQKMADSIIACCIQFVTEIVERKNNYSDTYIQEMLHMIDERLHSNQDLKTGIEFEVSLKQHICGVAARVFQKMHEDFLHVNDPYRCLSQNKGKFCADFKDVFHKRDQCHTKAEEFTSQCLKPAVEDFINRSLGPDIIDEMLTQQQFSTRISFQYSVLLDLLSKDNFEKYLSYICSYEEYVKKWILDQIVTHFSNGSKISEFEDRHIQSSIRSINDAINKAKMKKSGNLKTFVDHVCQELGDKLVISQDALNAFMILNNANQEQFADWLTECVNEMGKALREEFKKSNIQKKLKHLHLKPQNEIFTRLIGCGKQCPFCKAPCEAGGKAHTEHWASIHRSNGLGQFRFHHSEKLVTDVCSSLVISDRKFRCLATNFGWHPYKQYSNIFPTWRIPPDVSLEASDYWKYVMATFNKKFAEEYNAKPADIPSTWKRITEKQAKASLQQSFSI